ncbi:MAG TPA: GAF domain-containing protein [Vicinamibacterales bacterium]|nr:GAF domain-containing protein [Vicinamibacterales bacterium]
MKTHELTFDKVRAAVEAAPDAAQALDAAVRLLEADVPDYTWVGIYLLHGNELVLGPFVGKPSPHTRIPLGRGVCGAAAAEKATIIVDDVTRDTRYLACSAETKSEIVVPIMLGGDVLGEIDIDSDRAAAFGSVDRELLEQVAAVLAPLLRPA